MSEGSKSLFQRFGDRNPDGDLNEEFYKLGLARDAEGRKWCPMEFVEETLPTHLASAEAWAGWLVEHCGLEPGEAVEFHWEAYRGEVTLTVEADGNWSQEGQPKPGANSFAGYLDDDACGEPSLLGDDLADIAKQAVWRGSGHAFPMAIEVHCWELSRGDWRYRLVRRHLAGYGFERVPTQ